MAFTLCWTDNRLLRSFRTWFSISRNVEKKILTILMMIMVIGRRVRIPAFKIPLHLRKDPNSMVRKNHIWYFQGLPPPPPPDPPPVSSVWKKFTCFVVEKIDGSFPLNCVQSLLLSICFAFIVRLVLRVEDGPK